MNVTKKKRMTDLKEVFWKNNLGGGISPLFNFTVLYIHSSFIHIDAEPNLFIVNKLMYRIYYQSVVV